MATAIDKATDTSGQVDEADTSTTEDTFESLADDDASWSDGETVETTEESDTDSAATEEETETEEESDDDAETETTEDKTEEESDSNDEDKQASDTKAADKEAEERHQRNEEAKARRIADKEQRDQAKAKATQEALDASYQDTYDQAINAGFDDAQARIQAAQALTLQQLQVDAYQNRVMQVTNKVTGDLNQAVQAIPEFKSDNPIVRDAMLRAVDYFEAQHVVKDANGDPVQVTGDILAFLQTEAETIRKLTGVGAEQQEQAKNTQKKRTLAPPSRTPKKPKVDPDMAAFDEAFGKYR